jgi:hypothetical protein
MVKQWSPKPQVKGSNLKPQPSTKQLIIKWLIKKTNYKHFIDWSLVVNGDSFYEHGEFSRVGEIKTCDMVLIFEFI